MKLRWPLRVFIGWDVREREAYDVCRFSLERHSSIPLIIRPLIRRTLIREGLFWRNPNEAAATEFAFTRFLVPYLANYTGHALFVDCDFLFTADIAELIAAVDPDKAVSVVKHDYTPRGSVKMDGQPQVDYPRKNWSSLMVFNCGHPDVKALKPRMVSEAPAAVLHRFRWLRDGDIGELPKTWNWLVGEYDAISPEIVDALHFTNGGPWFPNCQGVDYADLWRAESVLAKAARPKWSA
jgi:hypothetical protein